MIARTRPEAAKARGPAGVVSIGRLPSTLARFAMMQVGNQTDQSAGAAVDSKCEIIVGAHVQQNRNAIGCRQHQLDSREEHGIHTLLLPGTAECAQPPLAVAYGSGPSATGTAYPASGSRAIHH